MARNLTAVGVGKDYVVQIALTFGIITGPFGVQGGAEKIGASDPAAYRRYDPN